MLLQLKVTLSQETEHTVNLKKHCTIGETDRISFNDVSNFNNHVGMYPKMQ